MASETLPHIGASFWLATAAPATNDTTGFEALTWVQVNGLQQLPQLGVTHAMIDIPDLQDGFTSAAKGMGTGQDTTAQFRDVPSDTGQGNIQTLADGATGIGSIKIIQGSGVKGAVQTGDPVKYATGILHSYMDIQGDGTTHRGFTVGFRQNDFTVEGTEPA